MTRVFCYGTLKAGFAAHQLISQGQYTFVGEARTLPLYEIRDMCGFPAMVEGNSFGNGVIGEVYECDDETLDLLDQYEGVAIGLFRRQEINLVDGTTAQAYLYNKSDIHHHPQIKSGRWPMVGVG